MKYARPLAAQGIDHLAGNTSSASWHSDCQEGASCSEAKSCCRWSNVLPGSAGEYRGKREVTLQVVAAATSLPANDPRVLVVVVLEALKSTFSFI
ncbi:hypothetical protein AKJ16_DCAP00014 [Drosera capensis]